MIDLQPAATALSRIVAGVRDDQLDNPTPCTESTVATLVNHVDGLALAFTAAAMKRPLEGNASLTDQPADGWRERIPERLEDLVRAWHTETAWTGHTRAGGVDLPGDAAGLIALNEVVVHGWDLAAATGQEYPGDRASVEGALQFVRASVEQNPNGTPGLFEAPVPINPDAPPLSRLVALTGRDPSWTPPA
jgi:uncharacterized protein (TIGR03086 family)